VLKVLKGTLLSRAFTSSSQQHIEVIHEVKECSELIAYL